MEAVGRRQCPALHDMDEQSASRQRLFAFMNSTLGLLEAVIGMLETSMNFLCQCLNRATRMLILRDAGGKYLL